VIGAEPAGGDGASVARGAVLAEQLEGLTVDLADAGFGNAEDGGNFSEAEAVEIIEGDDFAVTLGEELEFLDHAGNSFGMLHGVRGGGSVFVRKNLVEVEGAAGAAFDGHIEWEEADGADAQLKAVEVGAVEAELAAGFVISGGAAEALFEGVHGDAQLAGLVAGGAGHPVEAAEFVKDGTADAHGDVGGKGFGLGEVEAADGGDEAGEADTVEFIEVGAGGEVSLHLRDDGAHLGVVLFDEVTLRGSERLGSGRGGRSGRVRKRNAAEIGGGGDWPFDHASL